MLVLEHSIFYGILDQSGVVGGVAASILVDILIASSKLIIT